MFVSLSFVTLLQVVALPAVLSATVTAVSERGVVGTKTLHFGDHTIHVATVPIASSSSLIGLHSTHSTPRTLLTKRLTNDACDFGCAETCTNGLSTLTDPPLVADCTALAAAIQALAQSELTPTIPGCGGPEFAPECTNFSIPPGFEQQYSLGTCLAGFANLNPTGGPSLAFCDYLIAGYMPGGVSDCIVGANTTGALCLADTDQGVFYAIEVRHV